MKDLTKATMKELVEMYNELADAPVKRFADRKTAERRVAALMTELDEPELEVCFEDEEPALRKPKNAAGVAASWQDESVKAARAKRSGVFVTDESGKEMYFRSVKQAFEELGLPLKTHIKFRMELKRLGQIVDFGYGYTWKVVPLNY